MPDAPAPSAGPAWETIPHDVLCPLCEYNLRGLSDPRCPECGYQFDWADVTNPRTRLHPYLFEHHPEKNIRSFIRTLWGTLRPIRFWSSLSPTQPSRPGRLAVYWVLSSMLVLSGVLGQWVAAITTFWDYSNWRSYSPYVTTRSPSVIPFSFGHLVETARIAFQQDEGLSVIFGLTIFWLCWPLLTFFALSIFQISMARAKVKTIHVLRCLVYSFDVGAWLGILIGVFAIVYIWLPGIAFIFEWPLAIAGLILLLVIIRLWTAYRWYLRFRHPFWTIVLSQVVAILGAMVFGVVWGEAMQRYK
jgi:rubredoxin